MSKSTLLGKNIPFVEAAHHGGKQKPKAILLRTSWTTDEQGAANGIAQAWHNPRSRIDSCHYVVDVSQTLRCVPDKVVAFPFYTGYQGAISINVCHDPPTGPTELTLNRAAKLTARLCKLYSIPVRILSDEQEQRWLKHQWRRRGGIILKTVGEFPADEFFTMIERNYHV